MNHIRTQTIIGLDSHLSGGVTGRLFSVAKKVFGGVKRGPQPAMAMSLPTDKKKGKRNRSDPNGNTILRHIKYRQKVGGALPPPSLIELQVIGTGREGTPQAFCLSTQHNRYLFNCGEGTQRVVTEHKMKLSKYENVFITHNTWENIGGLLGMCLSLDATNVPQITIHGPPRVEKLASMSRSFAQLQNIEVVKQGLTEDFVDDTMRVTYIPLFPMEGVLKRDEDGPVNKRVRRETRDDPTSVVFVCKPHPTPGKLSLEKCVDLGVPRGPMLGQLKNGEEVTLEDGRVIKPEDILLPALPSNPIIVVECPSKEYLDSLCSNLALTRYQGKTDGCQAEDVADIVVHFTPEAVMRDTRYQTWMDRFGANTNHLVLNDRGSPVVFEGVYKIQAMLNLLHPGIFPLLPHQRVQDSESRDNSGSTNIVHGETNLKYRYRGVHSRSFLRDMCIQLDNEAYRTEALAQSEFAAALADLKQSLNKVSQTEAASSSSDYPEILFLGTGSAIPNKVRNVSAIWLNLSDDQSMLLDCGENTYGQLCRHYGNQTDEMLAKLSAIFVSHLHADHHMGVICVAEQRRRVLEQRGLEAGPLMLIIPGKIQPWVDSVNSDLLPVSHLLNIVTAESLHERNRGAEDAPHESVLKALCLSELKVVRVRHAQFPHGIVLTHRAGWKLVYSGDTMPCQNLVDAGMDCDVLIHEASMEDELEEEASFKKHSTVSQAIDIGMSMNARFILLTHFSQRYAKIPYFSDKFSNRVGVAFDNMRVKMSQLPLLPLFTPALKALFSESYADMEDKTARRAMKKQLEARLHQQQQNSETAEELNDTAKDKQTSVVT